MIAMHRNVRAEYPQFNNALTVAKPPFMVWHPTLIYTVVAANEGATQWPSRSIA